MKIDDDAIWPGKVKVEVEDKPTATHPETSRGVTAAIERQQIQAAIKLLNSKKVPLIQELTALKAALRATSPFSAERLSLRAERSAVRERLHGYEEQHEHLTLMLAATAYEHLREEIGALNERSKRSKRRTFDAGCLRERASIVAWIKSAGGPAGLKIAKLIERGVHNNEVRDER